MFVVMNKVSDAGKAVEVFNKVHLKGGQMKVRATILNITVKT